MRTEPASVSVRGESELAVGLFFLDVLCPHASVGGSSFVGRPFFLSVYVWYDFVRVRDDGLLRTMTTASFGRVRDDGLLRLWTDVCGSRVVGYGAPKKYD